MSKSHPRWRLAKKILTWLFFIAVAVLLVVYAQKVDWEEVWKVIRNYNRMVLLGAVGLVIVSYLMYGCYDLLGRAYCGHKLAKRQVMLVSFICYAFNLTLSTWVGGIGMRYRLYSRLGLPGGTITRIFSLSITTNWLGYILLGGVIFTIGVVQLPILMVKDQLATGKLVRVLDAWEPRREVIHAVYPSRRGLLPSVRTLVDFLTEEYARMVEE